jgi:putative ABC transport system permease protein
MKASFARFVNGLRALLRSRRRDEDLNSELQSYLESAIEANMAAGKSRAEAARAARLEMGSLDGVKEQARVAGWESILETTWQDLKYAARLLRKSPGFTAAAVLTLGLGIGGTTAAFSVVDALFVRGPEGVASPGTLRRLYVKRDEGTSARSPYGISNIWADAELIRTSGSAFTDVAAYRVPEPIDLGRGETASRVRASVVSERYFPLLGISAAAGRLFLPEDERVLGARPVAVISDALWQSQFARASDAIGRELLINGRRLQIVGVASRGFRGIDADPVSVWIPSAMAFALGLEDTEGDWRTRNDVITDSSLIARIASGTTEVAAASQTNAILSHAAHAEFDQTPDVSIQPISLAGYPLDTRMTNLALWTALAACLVLLIACANVANLLLARTVTRRRELAMRLSLGAGTWRIARQHLTESAVLGLLGCGVGLAIAAWAMGMMREFPIPPDATRIDARVLGVSLALTALTSVLFGVLPALRASRLDPMAGLKSAHTVGDLRRTRMSRTLVAIQVSLSFALLVGAGLFVRSLDRIAAVRSGVAWDRLLVVSANIGPDRYGTLPRQEFFALAQARIAAMPGIERVATTSTPPFGNRYSSGPYDIEGVTMTGRQSGASLNFVGPSYFETIGTRIVRGRAILATDTPGADPVAVVSESMAALMAPHGDPIGMCVKIYEGPCSRVVGIAETQRDHLLFDRGRPMLFRAQAQAPHQIAHGVPTLIARTNGAPESQQAAIRAALQVLRSDLPYVSVEPMAERLRSTLLPFRLGAAIFSAFGVLALALAGVGLYGLLGYFVAERTAEIGVRRALGAPSQSVIALVTRQSLAPVFVGVIAGLTVAFIGSRYLGSMLFGVEPRDAVSFVGAASFLLAAAFVATLVPAFRATRIDPIVALRQD